MLGARYYIALAGKDKVSNITFSPVSLGVIVMHECFSGHANFSMESVTAMLIDTKLRNLKPQKNSTS